MEPIAVIGMGCRFPQASSPDAFWELLRDGREAIAKIPRERWDIDSYYDPSPDTPGKMSTRWGGFLERVDEFDAEFFGFDADELKHVDPQQRLFLEVAWEALERGGIVPRSLAGTRTGVFIGLCTVDYHRLLYRNCEAIGPHSGTGTTMCIAANRLSYLLDLRGPSIAIDAACSSSLVTVHLACQSLRAGESDLCVAGGVNLILSPDSTISSSQTRLLSKTGRCRPFDAEADGYVRGEGCGAVVLKRLADARRDGDRILALIRGSAVNQDGLSNSLTAPNGLAQQSVIRQALASGGLRAEEIDYVEAHAVGTPLGDAIEFKALKAVLGTERDRPCWVSSAKPNIGHLEAASGMAALLKTILALQHETIPAHLHLDRVNAYMSLDDGGLAIPTQPQAWPRGERDRIAGISAFGFGGTNAHVVVQEAPAELDAVRAEVERPHHLLTLSAKTETALQELVQRYEAYLDSVPDVSLADLCFTANAGRTHFEHRLSVATETLAQLREQLRAFGQQRAIAGVASTRVKRRRPPKVAWLFPGASAEMLQLGRELYEMQPTFRGAFDRCDESWPQGSLRAGLLDTSASSIVTFAIQYAMAELWTAWGVQPRAVGGEGTGRVVAACVAGLLPLETASIVAAEGGDRDFEAVTRGRIAFIPQLAAESLAACDVWLSLGGAIAEVGGERFISLAPDLTGWAGLLDVLGQLYRRGVEIDWQGFDRDYPRRRIALPTYPFQRQSYWFEAVADSEPAVASTLPVELPWLLQYLREHHEFSEAQLAIVPDLLKALRVDARKDRPRPERDRPVA